MGDFHTTSMCRFMVATQAALRPLATAPAATRHRRMQHGVLEEMEASPYKMEKPVEDGKFQQKCGHSCQFQEGVLADSIQPYIENSPLKPTA